MVPAAAITVYGPGGALLLLAAGVYAASMYFLPTVIAVVRRQYRVTVLLVNLFLGWTGLGWLLALLVACSSRSDRTVVVQAMTPVVSPDGRWWWDGLRWRPTLVAGH